MISLFKCDQIYFYFDTKCSENQSHAMPGEICISEFVLYIVIRGEEGEKVRVCYIIYLHLIIS